jgi:hypothetical protein
MDGGMGRHFRVETRHKASHSRRHTFDFNCHPTAGVVDKSIQSFRGGKPIYERSKPDALHGAM